MGHVHVQAQLFQLGAVHRRHVDRELHQSFGQVIDHELSRFSCHGRLGLDGGSAQVRRHDHVRQLQQRMVRRRRLVEKDVEGGAGKMAGAQGVGEGRFADDAAAGAVEHPAPAPQQ